jgi:hypothetical protein
MGDFFSALPENEMISDEAKSMDLETMHLSPNPAQAIIITLNESTRFHFSEHPSNN